MKLLLTSAGVSNQSIHDALVVILGKPIAECKALLVPTAIYPFQGGAYMAATAITGRGKSPLVNLGWKAVGVLELTALPSIDKNAWVQSVQEADALLVWGGDPIYLAYWMAQSGLASLFPSLSNLVYVGVSAGAMAATTTIVATTKAPGVRPNALSSEVITFDTPQGEIKRTFVSARGAALVNFSIIPHFLNNDFPDASEANTQKLASKIPAPVYAIDDETAIKVTGDNVEVVSEGRWKLFNH